jgi:hypothetical protein
MDPFPVRPAPGHDGVGDPVVVRDRVAFFRKLNPALAAHGVAFASLIRSE